MEAEARAHHVMINWVLGGSSLALSPGAQTRAAAGGSSGNGQRVGCYRCAVARGAARLSRCEMGGAGAGAAAA